MCSCLVLVGQLSDAAVVTVEGLADAEGLHPVQQAIVDHLASQCGYCTPGVVACMLLRCSLASRGRMVERCEEDAFAGQSLPLHRLPGAIFRSIAALGE